MDKHKERDILLASLEYSRALRAARQHPYYDADMVGIFSVSTLAFAVLIALAIEAVTGGLYWVLDKAGLFGAIFRFLGW